MSTLADKLREARALIDTPEKWTQGANARDARRFRVLPEDPEAVCFCPNGALMRVGLWDRSLQAAWELFPVVGLTGWNDAHGRTHAEVLAAFDRAIEAAQAAT